MAAQNLLSEVLPQIGPQTSMMEKKLPTTSSPADSSASSIDNAKFSQGNRILALIFCMLQ